MRKPHPLDPNSGAVFGRSFWPAPFAIDAPRLGLRVPDDSARTAPHRDAARTGGPEKRHPEMPPGAGPRVRPG